MVSIIEALMPTLISLMQNSAKVISFFRIFIKVDLFLKLVIAVCTFFKVMATSAQLALQYAVKHVCSPKLLPHLQTAMSSKSKEIRR